MASTGYFLQQLFFATVFGKEFVGRCMNAHVRSLVEKVGNYKETFLVAKKNTPRVTEQAQ